MHVGLNLVFLVPGYTGGPETYARELIPELVAAAPQMRFTAFVSREAAAATDAPWGDLIPAVTIPVDARKRAELARAEQSLLPKVAARTGVDLLHSLGTAAPAWGRFRRVVTIHDVNDRLVPDAHRSALRLDPRFLEPLIARRSDRILTNTASTRQALQRLLKIPPAKVDVVPLGPGRSQLEDPMPEPQLRRRLKAGTRPIVLCVASKRPHKNLVRLLRALALIPHPRRPLLVLAGHPTPHEDQLRLQAASLGISHHVRFLGRISGRELEGLYGAAACLVAPSLAEGFGLPVLEAMVRGVPVACSGVGSLAEVAAYAALRFDPGSVQEISAAIDRLVRDTEEAQRLRVAGRERAARFSWAATASGTLACYERVLKR